jgi:hypothetical protein
MTLFVYQSICSQISQLTKLLSAKFHSSIVALSVRLRHLTKQLGTPLETGGHLA